MLSAELRVVASPRRADAVMPRSPVRRGGIRRVGRMRRACWMGRNWDASGTIIVSGGDSGEWSEASHAECDGACGDEHLRGLGSVHDGLPSRMDVADSALRERPFHRPHGVAKPPAGVVGPALPGRTQKIAATALRANCADQRQKSGSSPTVAIERALANVSIARGRRLM